jgi:competence protein ComEC
MIRCRASLPVLFAAAFWAALFFFPHLPALGLGLASLALCAAALALLAARAGPLRGAGLSLAALGLGLALGLLRLWPYPAQPGGPAGGELGGLPLSRVAGFRGVLAEDSRPAGEGAAYRLRLRSIWTQGREQEAAARGEVQVLARRGQRLFWGREVEVSGNLSPVREPGGSPFIGPASSIVASGYVSPLLAWRADAYQGVERRFQVLGPSVAALLSALLLGDRAGVPEQDLQWFRSSGSLHILALSGMHVGILYALLSALLFFLPDRRWRLAAAALLILPYLFLTGASPSLLRAALMLLAAALGLALDRDAAPLNLLSLAAAVILMMDPLAAYELSFQLSFLSLLGILLAGPPLRRLLAPVLPPVLAAPLALSVGAQAATAPLLLAWFGAFYPAGALAALPLIPLVTAFIWSGLGCLLLSLLPWPLLPLLARPMQLLYGAIIWLLRVFSLPPIRAFWQPWYWIPVAVLFAALLAAPSRIRVPAPSRIRVPAPSRGEGP